MAVYGAGMIEDYLVIGAPEPWGEPPDGDRGDMRAGTAFVRGLWQESRKELFHGLDVAGRYCVQRSVAPDGGHALPVGAVGALGAGACCGDDAG